MILLRLVNVFQFIIAVPHRLLRKLMNFNAKLQNVFKFSYFFIKIMLI